eukprot:CAMPEP_0197653788 /NCGR_PEP_ID=MMETSP1338-20131121/37135_1 /TAXON_ID=43686 ORGANISM="Pelagodinium beii, Strain RCC1491" /NCGR_SAMPLE_ID=MMETSP1338 /ASSEMBLY_ACC=CAM_ASM_000754 /LENGTH=387 /DNA_ID=CAMNT_0043229031 /DNA_START=49 /DNA_END=1212 /DNA_ORIENTATION=-
MKAQKASSKGGSTKRPDSREAAPPPTSKEKAQKPPGTERERQVFIEVRDTYGRMSAKSRGVRLHTGPLKLRHSMPARDCTSWVHDDKQYSPYSYFENPLNKPAPLPAKSKGPPPLWLPPRSKARSQPASPTKGGKGSKKSVLGEIQAKPWDTEHHVMVSRMNDEVQVGVREYFDVPKRKEGEGIPKLRERYVMNDRQAGWNDEPDALGEMRRTLFNNAGPYNLGGCKQQQLPSWWRKIKDWGSYSYSEMPNLRTSTSEAPVAQKSLLASLANTPGHKSAEFWRGFAESGNNFARVMESEDAEEFKSRLEKWDNNWHICSSGNDEVNQRNREYFSVPEGGNGRQTEQPRDVTMAFKSPLATTFAEGMRSLGEPPTPLGRSGRLALTSH